MNETDKAYLAGIIDGEGWITLHRQKRGHVYLRVGVTNTDATLIRWLENSVLGGHTNMQGPGKSERCKPRFIRYWDKDEAAAVLIEVLPYLKLKTAQAKLILALHQDNTMAAKESGSADGRFRNYRPLPEWLIVRREDVYKQIRKLNRKGISMETVN